MTDKPPLTPETADKLLDAAAGSRRRSSLAVESLWGAQAIADFMGVSDDFVRKLAKDSTAPIRKRGGRYYSTRSEITDWLSPPP